MVEKYTIYKHSNDVIMFIKFYLIVAVFIKWKMHLA